MRRVELAIVGGGPAGLAAAIEAARRGIDAVVLERRAGVVDKACGEGLMPGAVAALDELGVELPRARPFLGVAYRDSVDETLLAEGTFSAGPGMGVRRVRLHEALRKAAYSAGCRIITHRVTSIQQDQGSVWVGPGIQAQWVIAADGLHSRIRRQMGLEMGARSRNRFGLRRHFHLAPWSERVEVHWSHVGEAYVTPVGEDLVGVAFLFTAPGRYEDLLRHFPVLRERLADAQPATDATSSAAPAYILKFCMLSPESHAPQRSPRAGPTVLRVMEDTFGRLSGA